jgi:hypothetical protein
MFAPAMGGRREASETERLLRLGQPLTITKANLAQYVG